MKNRLKIILTIALLPFFTMLTAHAQDNCEVLMASIKGTYTGGCNNNKADGDGESVGTDSYKGHFKKGMPDGAGVYTWKNGDTFTGTWEKGKRNGKGVLTTKADGKVTEGFWKDDNYLGQYEKPFKVVTRPVKVTMLSIKKNNGGKNNSITFQLESVANGSSTQARLRELLTDKAKYEGLETLTELATSTTYRMNGVKFPIQVKLITSSDDEIVFDIYESGEWNVNIGLNQ